MTFADVYTAAWQAAYGAAPVTSQDTYQDAYTATYGTALTPPGVQAAMQLGSGDWQDITGDMFGGLTSPIAAITRGRQDETTQASPSALSATLDNRTGNYSPRNPAGAYYGLFGRNTPVRVSVPALEPFLRLENDNASGASCPDSAQLDTGGQLDLRIDVTLSSYAPCVLASKWAGLTSAPVTTTPPPVPGSTVFQANYPGTGSQLAACKQFDGYLGGRTAALNAQRVYCSSSGVAPFPTSMNAGEQALLNNKCLLVVSWKPATDGSDAAALLASIGAFLSAAAAAGAPQPLVVLHHEPQGDFPASTFISMFRTYYPQIKAAYPSVQVGYIALGIGAGTVQAYYPGDAYCDFLMQDIYGHMWRGGQGSNLDTMMAIAQAATPPKPVGLGEVGETTNPDKRLTTAQFAAFMDYLTSEFQAVADGGYPAAPVMWFNGQGPASLHPNVIVAGDPRIPALEKWYDAMSAITGTSGGTTAAQRSWALVLNGDGTLGFWWTRDGTLATLHQVNSALPVPLGRITLRVLGTTGASPSVAFFSGPGGCARGPDITGGPPWQPIGPPVTVGSLNVFNGSAPLAAGYSTAVAADFPDYPGMTGLVHELALRSFQAKYSDTYTDSYGASPLGATVAGPAFYTLAPGTVSFTDGQGNPWTLAGAAEVTQADYRFHGELAALPVTWDPTATDIRAPVQAGGLLRRMSQGQQAPVASAFKRAVLGLSGDQVPVAYWACEDTAGAGTLGPSIGPAAITFTVAPSLASDSAFDCSLPIPALAFSRWNFSVAPYTGSSSVVVRFLMHVPAGGGLAADTVLARFNTTGPAGIVTLRWEPGGALRLTGYGQSGGGSFLWDTGNVGSFSVNGELALVSIELTRSGSALAWQLAVLAAGQDTPVTVNGTVASARPGHITGGHVNADGTSLNGTGIGHLFVQNTYQPVTDFAQALAAYAGETCANRFGRLCTENGITARIYGAPDEDVPMGAQTADTLVNLLQACEATGRGQLYEPRQVLGLGYRTVRALCQQPPAVTLDASLGHLDALVPTDDDQRTVNDVTVTSSTGGSYRAVLDDGSPMSISPPPAGAGDYGNSYSVNTAEDAQLPGLAGWLLNVGAVDEERYPQAPADLMGAHLASYRPAIQQLDIGSLLAIVNPPPGLPPDDIRQLVWGYQEQLGTNLWQMQWNLVPESPYETGIYADPVFGRMDTDGSQLDPGGPGIGTGDTVFNVVTVGPSGIGWTTAVADFPFDVVMGGEQMTVTGISSPGGAFLTGDNSGFEASLGNWAAGAGCTIARTTAHHHTGIAALAITSSGTGTETALSCPPGSVLTEGMAVAPGDQCTGSAWFKAATSGRFCAAAIDWYDSSGTFLSTSIGTPLISGTTGWQQGTVTGNAPAAAAFAVLDLQVATTALDAGLVTYADDAQMSDVTASASPSQQFTVIRSVNGVVKAHNASEPVSLAHPAIIALA